MSETPPAYGRAAPRLGEHTRAVLAEPRLRRRGRSRRSPPTASSACRPESLRHEQELVPCPSRSSSSPRSRSAGSRAPARHERRGRPAHRQSVRRELRVDHGQLHLRHRFPAGDAPGVRRRQCRRHAVVSLARAASSASSSSSPRWCSRRSSAPSLLFAAVIAGQMIVAVILDMTGYGGYAGPRLRPVAHCRHRAGARRRLGLPAGGLAFRRHRCGFGMRTGRFFFRSRSAGRRRRRGCGR